MHDRQNLGAASELGAALFLEHHVLELVLPRARPLRDNRLRALACPAQGKINHTVDIRKLKYYLEQGVELLKVNQCLKYNPGTL